MRYAFSLAAAVLLLTPSASAQTAGQCTLGSAEAELSLSDVRARVYNTGALFFNGDGQYEVPQGDGVNAIYSAGLWIGGVVDGELRVAAATYAQNGDDYEFWPGPLDEGATLPNSGGCASFDRIYRISVLDVFAYEAGEEPSADLAEWPVGLGAPAVNADNTPVVVTAREQTLDLAAGQRPVIYGTETAFWVMNDVGNEHLSTQRPPLGIEVRVSAFSINDPDEAALDQGTFYRYEVVNRSPNTLGDLHVGFWIDPDLGDFEDDYVGSDPGRSLFYAYNADNEDGGPSGYGTAPPAIGVDLLTDATYGMYFNNDNDINGNPGGGIDYYNYLRGRWRDGRPWTRGFGGLSLTQPVTDWLFDGDPTAADTYWSERDQDPAAGEQPRTPGDRRGVLSVASSDLASGGSRVFDVAVVFARGADHLDSVTELRAASDLVQSRYDNGLLFQTTAGDVVLPAGAGPAADVLALSVYPNPSRGAARVSFSVPTTGTVRVHLTDALGRLVAVLADGVRAAGPHQVRVPAHLAEGVYAVTVEAGGARAVRTLTTVR